MIEKKKRIGTALEMVSLQGMCEMANVCLHCEGCACEYLCPPNGMWLYI